MTRRARAICTADGCERTYAIDPRRKTTLCRQHASQLFAQDPARNAKLSKSMAEKHADPQWKALRAPSCAAAGRKLAANEEFTARNREHMRRVGQKYGGSVKGSESRKLAGQKVTATTLAHIPLEYRADYRALMISGRVRKPERVRLINDLVKADQKRFESTGKLPQLEREKRRKS